MARNQTQLSQVIDDFIISLDSDNYAAGASDNIIRSYALRGIREMGFDILKKIRSLKITVDTSNNTAEFPDDFVDWSKIGVVGEDGIVYALGENKNINQSQAHPQHRVNQNIMPCLVVLPVKLILTQDVFF